MGRQPSAAYNPHCCRGVPVRLYHRLIIASHRPCITARRPVVRVMAGHNRERELLAEIELLREQLDEQRLGSIGRSTPSGSGAARLRRSASIEGLAKWRSPPPRS